MKNFFLIIFSFLFSSIYSQELPNFEAVDSLYREDQFYFNLSYNVLRKLPYTISQNSLSAGINLGILRDFPINKSRTVAIAPGLGFSFNNYQQNLVIEQKENAMNYSTIPFNTSYDRNKLTFNSHKFYRIYGGIKFSYLLYSRSRYIAEGKDFKVDNNPDLNKFQYGVYLCSGYNSANFFVYYGLQDIFKNGTLNNNPLALRTVNLGFMFYIL
jgi:hypothetical protein